MNCRIIRRSVSSYSSKLISDPFKIDNTRKMRDTSSIFPKPNIVSFDAFGTIYIPKVPVFQQYFEISSDMGFEKSIDSIKEDFPVVFSGMNERFPNFGKNSKEITSVESWWSELIVKLYGIDHYTESEKSLELCNRLLDRFSSAEGYHLYEDVIPTISRLKDKGVNVVVSSNSDSRVINVLESLGVMKYLDVDDIYLSYDLDFEKPSKLFFDSVLDSHFSKTSRPSKEERVHYLSNVWHIGDSHDADYLGAVRSGWNGVFLDRDAKSRYLSYYIPDPEDSNPSCMGKPPTSEYSDKPMQLIANNRAVISDLRQLLDLYDM